MAHGTNLYILLPENQASTEFVNANKSSFLNIGGNEVVLSVLHPDQEKYPELMVYQIEMSDNVYHEFETELNDLSAEEALTAEQYRIKYPSKEDT